ncbi:hypothetical protein V8C42DRAFT_338991, partial [Trichoderma barbatum]
MRHSIDDHQILEKVQKRAKYLDNLYNVCGIRIGLSSLAGIVPIVGDFLDAYLALHLVYTSCRDVHGGIPHRIRFEMLLNVFLDFIFGLLPVLGDILDIFFRANIRNAELLEQYLTQRGL